MPDRFHLARWFLAGGAALAGIGFALWHLLPIPLAFPPYVATASVALLYGAACLVPNRPSGDKKS